MHRSDANQAAIVAMLRALGATVDVVGEPVDLLVGFRGKNYLMEVKVDEKAPLRPSQLEFFRTWCGQVARVNSEHDAMAVLGLVRV